MSSKKTHLKSLMPFPRIKFVLCFLFKGQHAIEKSNANDFMKSRKKEHHWEKTCHRFKGVTRNGENPRDQLWPLLRPGSLPEAPRPLMRAALQR